MNELVFGVGGEHMSYINCIVNCWMVGCEFLELWSAKDAHTRSFGNFFLEFLSMRQLTMHVDIFCIEMRQNKGTLISVSRKRHYFHCNKM